MLVREDSSKAQDQQIWFVRLTFAFQPQRLTMAPAADGCKRLLGGPFIHRPLPGACSHRCSATEAVCPPLERQ